MKNKFEMLVNEYFKLSIGHIAFTGKIVPDIDLFIPKCEADLYIGKEKIKRINILGEDRFVRSHRDKRTNKKSARTDEDIYTELKESNHKKIKLIFLIK